MRTPPPRMRRRFQDWKRRLSMTGARLMSRQADFNIYEWTQLKETPRLVGLAMMAVSSSGPIGKVREFVALSSCLTPEAVPEQFRGNELVMAIVDDYHVETSSLLGRLLRSDNGLSGLLGALLVARRNVLEYCESVTALLAARSPQAEAEGVRRWLLWVARRVADASGDRWLGMGRKVSFEEASMLSRIAEALGFPIVEAAPTPDELEAMLGYQPAHSADGSDRASEDGASR
jgi:hypothetical protein